MSRHTRNLLQIHVAVLLFGFAGLFGNRTLLPLSPLVIVFGRVGFASMTLLVVTAGKRSRVVLPGHRLGVFALLGFLLAVHWTTFFQAVQESSVALALITFSTFPVFVAFLEPLLFRERWRGEDVILALVALTGIVILTPNLELRDRTTQGALWGIASGLTFALLSLLNRKYVQHYSSITIALYQNAFAGLALLPFVLGQWPDFTLRDVLLVGVLGVFCTAVAHSLFIAGMHGIPARTASMIACLEPIYGTILALLFLDEVPAWRTLLGGAVVLAVAVYATLRAGQTPTNLPEAADAGRCER